jgi:hypothetical protein
MNGEGEEQPASDGWSQGLMRRSMAIALAVLLMPAGHERWTWEDEVDAIDGRPSTCQIHLYTTDRCSGWPNVARRVRWESTDRQARATTLYDRGLAMMDNSVLRVTV